MEEGGGGRARGGKGGAAFGRCFCVVCGVGGRLGVVLRVGCAMLWCVLRRGCHSSYRGPDTPWRPTKERRSLGHVVPIPRRSRDLTLFVVVATGPCVQTAHCVIAHLFVSPTFVSPTSASRPRPARDRREKRGAARVRAQTRAGTQGVCVCVFFFSILFVFLALLSCSLPVVAQVRGHIAGPSPPCPLRYVPSFLSREELGIFFPRRVASNCDMSC